MNVIVAKVYDIVYLLMFGKCYLEIYNHLVTKTRYSYCLKHIMSILNKIKIAKVKVKEQEIISKKSLGRKLEYMQFCCL